ncbi:MAG: efflux RND transporter periplasmic adaptor subunit [Acidobacteriota bacterium]|jgi:membrane fusion protein (multidrug efflux system)|nr:efflux RND transporter periplasmic adaptor subunit [Acidobacteriota bacterium]
MAGCQKPQAPPPAAAPEVSVVEVSIEPVALTTELPGRTNAWLVAEIRPQVSGLLQERLFTEGSDVKQDSILYNIDPAQYQAAYDQAVAALKMSEANIALAEANLPAIRSRAARLKELAAIRAAGAQDADDAAAALLQAEANLALQKSSVEVNRAAVASAKINLTYTPIKAPISGRIGRSAVTVGSMVTAYQGEPLAVIQQLDPIYVDVTQSNAEVLSLRRNFESGALRQGVESRRKVKLILEDGSEYEHTGTLQFQDVTVEQTTGSVTLRISFPNPKHVLLPGMFVRAIVEEGVNENAMMVPQPGVNRDTRGNPIALVVDSEGKVEQKPLELDRAIGDKWLVTKGLAPGDKVIVEGSQNVRVGATVRVAAAVPSTLPGQTAPVQAK